MDKMKLGDFIAQTINEIINGVSQAQENAKDKGAQINPRHVSWNEGRKSYIMKDVPGADEFPLVTEIDFDILLTIGNDDKAQGGIGIFAASVGLGVKGELKEHTESVNRINFQILAKLPQQKK